MTFTCAMLTSKLCHCDSGPYPRVAPLSLKMGKMLLHAIAKIPVSKPIMSKSWKKLIENNYCNNWEFFVCFRSNWYSIINYLICSLLFIS